MFKYDERYLLVGLSPYYFCSLDMSGFVTFGSRRISLAEHSYSSFALVVSYLCVGDDLPPSSSDANKGCQWEIQTDEG
jgi:hypothetical protein